VLVVRQHRWWFKETPLGALMKSSKECSQPNGGPGQLSGSPGITKNTIESWFDGFKNAAHRRCAAKELLLALRNRSEAAAAVKEPSLELLMQGQREGNQC